VARGGSWLTVSLGRQFQATNGETLDGFFASITPLASNVEWCASAKLHARWHRLSLTKIQSDRES
jgi:hypothetical protein